MPLPANVVDYVVISDAKVTIPLGVPQELLLSFPDGTPMAGAPLVLYFVLDTGPPVHNLTFRISTVAAGVPRVEFNGIFSSDVFETLHEVIDPLPAGTTTLRIEYLSGTGTLEIGDIVLYFRKTIIA